MFPLALYSGDQHNLLYIITGPSTFDSAHPGNFQPSAVTNPSDPHNSYPPAPGPSSFNPNSLSHPHQQPLTQPVSIIVTGRPFTLNPSTQSIDYPTEPFVSRWSCSLDLSHLESSTDQRLSLPAIAGISSSGVSNFLGSSTASSTSARGGPASRPHSLVAGNKRFSIASLASLGGPNATDPRASSVPFTSSTGQGFNLSSSSSFSLPQLPTASSNASFLPPPPTPAFPAYASRPPILPPSQQPLGSNVIVSTLPTNHHQRTPSTTAYIRPKMPQHLSANSTSTVPQVGTVAAAAVMGRPKSVQGQTNPNGWKGVVMDGLSRPASLPPLLNQQQQQQQHQSSLGYSLDSHPSGSHRFESEGILVSVSVIPSLSPSPPPPPPPLPSNSSSSLSQVLSTPAKGTTTSSSLYQPHPEVKRLDSFSLEVFVFNQSDRVRRFTVGVPEKRRRRRGSTGGGGGRMGEEGPEEGGRQGFKGGDGEGPFEFGTRRDQQGPKGNMGGRGDQERTLAPFFFFLLSLFSCCRFHRKGLKGVEGGIILESLWCFYWVFFSLFSWAVDLTSFVFFSSMFGVFRGDPICLSSHRSHGECRVPPPFLFFRIVLPSFLKIPTYFSFLFSFFLCSLFLCRSTFPSPHPPLDDVSSDPAREPHPRRSAFTPDGSGRSHAVSRAPGGRPRGRRIGTRRRRRGV